MRGGAGVFLLKLDAVSQSPTLARPAAPLAACVQWISSADNTTKNTYSFYVLSVDKTNKIGCPGNVPWGITNHFQIDYLQL